MVGSPLFRSRRRVMVGGALAAVGLVAGLLGAANPANAAAQGGFLQIHGSGTTFAGSNTYASIAVASGNTATYTLAVANKGSAQAQFNVRISDDGFGESETLAAGSILTTPLAQGPIGYFTPPVNPGKNQLLTLKVKTPTESSEFDHYIVVVSLYDTAGNFLNNEQVYTGIKSATGAAPNDVYTTTLGGSNVIAAPDNFSITVAQSIKGTAKASYTVKLQNDTITKSQISAQFTDEVQCGAAFPTTIKRGATDVTAAVRAGTYLTPLLAHAASVTLTVTVGVPSVLSPGCGFDSGDLTAWVGASPVSSSFMITNITAS